MNFSFHPYSKDEKDFAFKRSTVTSIAQGSHVADGSAVERLDKDSDKNKNGDLYIRAFITKPGHYNKQGWAIDPTTADYYIHTMIGQPAVLYKAPCGTLTHPEYNITRSAQANLKEEQKYKVGVVEEVHKDDEGNWFGHCKIDDPDAKEYINKFTGKKVPIHVSPALDYDPNQNLSNFYSNKYRWDHIAIVDEPAYPWHLAQVQKTCVGEKDSCMNKLRSATASVIGVASASASASTSLSLKPASASLNRHMPVPSYFVSSVQPANGKKPGTVA
jgi:hypothetical protein